MAQQTSAKAEDDLPGLTQAEAARRRGEVGPNAIHEAVPTWWRALAGKFWGPVPWLLEAVIVLLATVPLALPATFTLSAALGAQRLGRHGVLLTRLAAAHEAAAMDLLCADKTGTLTQNALQVAAVVPVPGTTREQVLALAALASTPADQDPVDAAIRAAAAPAAEQVTLLEPFDPDTKRARALAVAADGSTLEVIKGALSALAALAPVPTAVREAADALAADGQRVLAVAAGAPGTLRIAGLIALGDPPREDAAALVQALRETGVHTVMISGDAALTAAAVARRVGIAGGVCPPERLGDAPREFGVYARVLPQDKFRLVAALVLGRRLGALDPVAVPTLAFVAIAYGNQAVLFALRERGRLWHSRPSVWLLAAAALDIAIVTALALSGTLMAPLRGGVRAGARPAQAAAARRTRGLAGSGEHFPGSSSPDITPPPPARRAHARPTRAGCRVRRRTA